MKFRLFNYNSGFRIVSLALDIDTFNDLKEDKLDYIYVCDNRITLYPDTIELYIEDDKVRVFSCFNNYDVFIIDEDGSVIRCYDNSSNENSFFISGKCNSNCIMCPSPDITRINGKNSNIGDLIEIAKHIPITTEHITITGGEPFMVGESIFKLFEYFKTKFANTEFLLLTNGRIFAVDKYLNKFVETAPNNIIVGIPIHGSCFNIHDYITRAKNSFNQTLFGIKRLLANKIKVELRIVVNKINANDIYAISKLINKELHDVFYVSIIAMEMTGNAYKNSSEVWIPYRESFNYVEGAIDNLIENGIDVKLYNFPICTVKRKYWTLCEKSISSYKIKFDDKCKICGMKEYCGGLFRGTYKIERNELNPII